MGLAPLAFPPFLLVPLPRLFSKLGASFPGKRAVVQVVDCTSPSSSGLQFLCLSVGRLDLILSEPFLSLQFSRSRMEVGKGVLMLAEDPDLGTLCSQKCLFHSTSLPHPRESIRNCALSMDQIPDLHSPMSPISESPSSPAYSTGMAHGGVGAGRGIWWK